MEKHTTLNSGKNNDSFNARWEAAKLADEAIRRRKLGLEAPAGEKKAFPLQKQAEKVLQTGVTLAAAATLAAAPVLPEAQGEEALLPSQRPAIVMTLPGASDFEEAALAGEGAEERRREDQREDRLLAAARTLLTAAGALFSLLLRMLSSLVPLMRTGFFKQIFGVLLPLLSIGAALFVFLSALYLCFFPVSSLKTLWSKKNLILFGILALLWRAAEGLFSLTGLPFLQGLLGWLLDGLLFIGGWYFIVAPLVKQPQLSDRFRRMAPWVLATQAVALVFRIVGMYQRITPLPGVGLALLFSGLSLGLLIYIPRTAGSLSLGKIFLKKQ